MDHLIPTIDRDRKLISFNLNGKRVFWMSQSRWERLKSDVDRKIATSHRF